MVTEKHKLSFLFLLVTSVKLSMHNDLPLYAQNQRRPFLLWPPLHAQCPTQESVHAAAGAWCSCHLPGCCCRCSLQAAEVPTRTPQSATVTDKLCTLYQTDSTAQHSTCITMHLTRSLHRDLKHVREATTDSSGSNRYWHGLTLRQRPKNWGLSPCCLKAVMRCMG